MTNLSLDDVVALNALIVTAIGLTFVLGRKDRTPPPLDLAGSNRKPAVDEAPGKNSQSIGIAGAAGAAKSAASKGTGARTSGGGYGSAALHRLEQEEQQNRQDPHVTLVHSRQLNVFFNWNGHTWDAYEVLGVPAGASRDTVVKAFHECRSKSPDSIAFLQAATDAILKR